MPVLMKSEKCVGIFCLLKIEYRKIRNFNRLKVSLARKFGLLRNVCTDLRIQAFCNIRKISSLIANDGCPSPILLGLGNEFPSPLSNDAKENPDWRASLDRLRPDGRCYPI
jgi:hypothetical protein